MKALTNLVWLWLSYTTSSHAKPTHYNMTLPNLRTILTSSDVHWSSNTIIAFPDSYEFTNATERREAANEPTFGASITPANEHDVAAAVKLAVQNNIPFLATGGRHGGGLGYGKMQGGLAIDLSNFKSFKADTDASTVTIGGAASIGEFHNELYESGLMLPSGSCACPGYAGLAVGGGIGRYSGSLGLVTDRLIAARVVTSRGEIINVSETENADLFWGLRGAGANFGIITSATYKAARAAEHANGYALTVDLHFGPNATAAYFKHLESIADDLPGNVGGLHLTSYNFTNDRAEMFVNWVWFGQEQEGRAFIDQFMAFGPYRVENYDYIPWNQIMSMAGNGLGENELCIPEVYANTYASNLKQFSASTFQATFDKLQQFYIDYPEGRASGSNLEILPNQAVAAMPEDFDAYPWRDTKGFFTVSASFLDTESLSNQTLLDAGDRLGRELRDSWTKTGGYAKEGGTIYVNYAHGDESIERVYGVNKLPRLAALKKKWDPRNVFRFNNPLPTSYP